MPLTFPASPTNGQVYIPTHAKGSGPIYTYNSALGAWTKKAGTALPTNLFINPAMQISQQNGNTGGATIDYYAADQWASGLASMTWQRVALTTPRGSLYRLRGTIHTTIASGGTNAAMSQVIEGTTIAGLSYGTAGGLYTVMRVGVRASKAGTYAIGITGAGGGTKAISFPLVLPLANTDYEFAFAVPRPPIASWIAGNTETASLFIGYITQATWQAAPYAWNAIAGTGVTGNNVTGAVNDTFDVFDVGWYPDPNMTGVEPEFVAPHIEDDLKACQRYWYRAFGQRGIVTTATVIRAGSLHPVPMRATPTVALVGTGLRAYDIAAASVVTSLANVGSTFQHLDINFTRATGLTVGRRGTILVDSFDAQTGVNYVAVSARL